MLQLLVFALGSISSPADQSSAGRRVDTPREHPGFRAGEQYFWASQSRIGGLYCESHLISAQCAFFSAVYLSFTMRTLAAWKAFAQAGTHCLAYIRTQGLMHQSSNAYQSGCANSDAGTTTTSPGASYWETTEQRFRDDSLYWVILKGEA